MKRYTIKIARTTGFFVSNNSLGTDALNAISSVPGVVDLEIEEEVEDEVTLSYSWTAAEKFQETAEHLGKFGLRRVDW